MRILVTGHNGFIGRHVFRALQAAGHEVAGYDWPDNLCELGEVREFDAVVNLAAIGGAGRAARSPAEVMKNNVGATIALRGALSEEFTLMRTTGHWPAVVHISSFSVYGNAPVPTPNDAPIAPLEIYGASKAAQELCWAGYPGPLVILRLSSVYGPGMRLDDPEATVIAKVAKATFDQVTSDQECFTIFGNGEQVRDFVHVGDVADSVVRMVERNKRDGSIWDTTFRGALNICSGYEVSINRLCDIFGVDRTYDQARAGDMEKCLGQSDIPMLLERAPARLEDHWKEVLK